MGGMEIVWFLLAFVNIFVAVIPPFNNYYSYTNPIAGILLALSFPLPARLLKLNHFIAVHMTNKYNDGRVYDAVCDGLTFFWVLCFTSWDLLFVFTHSTNNFLMHSFHLVPNCLRCILTKQYDLWGELRVFTFAVMLFGFTVMRQTDDPINAWYLNAENVDFILNASTNKYVIEIWGTINVILASIHCIIWIKELIRRRGIAEDDVDQILVQNEEMDNNENATQITKVLEAQNDEENVNFLD